MWRSGETGLEDAYAVSETAEYLNISEFKVFANAWYAWYGYPAEECVIEQVFCDYLFNVTAPFWVRHYTRAVLSRIEGMAVLVC